MPGNPVNKIWGNASFNNVTPDTLDMKIWLITYDPGTNLLTAVDSTYSCLQNGVAPYYEFNNEPAGSYLVKGQLLYGNAPGNDGYIPTYSIDQLNWSNATSMTHAAANDGNVNITMQYGTVPTGPGFIGGDVLSGANKNTDGGVPVNGMLVYLQDANSHVLRYTYTDVDGNYSFSNIANGQYIIYPEAINYATTPFTNITVNNGQVNNINFKQHTSLLTITPYAESVSQPTTGGLLQLYPNPATQAINVVTTKAATYTIRDVPGREMMNGELKSGSNIIMVDKLPAGSYTLQSDGVVMKFVKE